jgi:hypothetical protein
MQIRQFVGKPAINTRQRMPVECRHAARYKELVLLALRATVVFASVAETSKAVHRHVQLNSNIAR